MKITLTIMTEGKRILLNALNYNRGGGVDIHEPNRTRPIRFTNKIFEKLIQTKVYVRNHNCIQAHNYTPTSHAVDCSTKKAYW